MLILSIGENEEILITIIVWLFSLYATLRELNTQLVFN